MPGLVSQMEVIASRITMMKIASSSQEYEPTFDRYISSYFACRQPFNELLTHAFAHIAIKPEHPAPSVYDPDSQILIGQASKHQEQAQCRAAQATPRRPYPVQKASHSEGLARSAVLSRLQDPNTRVDTSECDSNGHRGARDAVSGIAASRF